jgi:lactate dehydrogenase-like 2-hydroxyacid dehydrogenase
VREGRWSPAAKPPLTRRVWGRKAGILGMGRIGLAIAKRCAAFDMEVGYHNRRPRPETPYRYFPDLVAMAQWADVIIVASPGGAETRHLVDAKVLAALGKDGIVVNIARGTVIDEAALIAALRDGTIAGAGLDVFEREPEVPAELMRMDNVVLAPHMAGSTNETWDDCEAMASENLRRFFAGEKPLSPV